MTVSYNLMIVESPSKAKTISKWMGKEWRVAASVGHICDLPKNEMGFKAPDYKPNYVVYKDKKKIVTRLRKLVRGSSLVYIASDADREGEAIGFHLIRELKIQQAKIRRIRVNAIKENLIKAAVQSPAEIDMNLVRAQEARRVIDRLVGYTVSPYLGKHFGKSKGKSASLSAGRVQSVALLLVVHRERSIRAFVPKGYYDIELNFETNTEQGIKKWNAKWLPKPYFGDGYCQDIEIARDIASTNKVIVKNIEVKRKNIKPPPAFISTTMCKAANIKLGLSTKQTMDVAQSLYTKGLISYHRTDDPNLSAESIEEIRTWMQSNGQGLHLPDKPNKWKKKKGAQEAHEAIRPAHFNCDRPDSDGTSLSDHELALYQLIRLRAVASQMKAAVYDVTKVTLEGNHVVSDKKPLFVASGRVLIYPGWHLMTGGENISDDKQGGESDGDDDKQSLPKLTEKEKLEVQGSCVHSKQTRPPKRYTEPTLVSELEKKEIGRPSTYASIFSRIIEKSYVQVKKRMLHPSALGEQVIAELEGKFEFVDPDYTRRLEQALDKIAAGDLEYKKVVSFVHKTLEKEMAELTQGSSLC